MFRMWKHMKNCVLLNQLSTIGKNIPGNHVAWSNVSVLLLRWIARNPFSATASISAQPRWLYQYWWVAGVSHSPMPCDLLTWQSLKEWPKLGLGSSLAFWVVETVDGAITSTWLVILSQKSIDALNSYGQLLFDKDITLTIVLFIIILQNKQNTSCFVTINSWNSRRIDIIVKATKSFRVRGNVMDENFV